MKKVELPKDWIVVKSSSYPDRVYYFNVRTNKNSWVHPSTVAESEASDDIKTTPSKRRKRGSSTNQPSTTSPTNSPPHIEERRKLKAKRRLPSADGENVSSSQTPQMIAIRQKMQERQAKGNAITKAKITVDTEIKIAKKDLKKAESATTSSADDRQSLTPQMQVLKEKIAARKSLQNLNPRAAKKKIKEPSKVEKTVSETGNCRRETRSRSKSMGANNQLSPEKCVSTSTNDSRHSSQFTIPKKPREKRQRQLDLSASRKRERPAETLSSPSCKNSAQERMDNIRKNLSTDEQDSTATRDNSEKSPVQHKTLKLMIESSPPNIYKNAETRMKLLRESLSNSVMKENLKNDLGNSISFDLPLGNINDSQDTFCEEMEWEPIADERIINEIEAVRIELGSEDVDILMEEPPENSLDLTDGPSKPKTKVLYIVVDTNVFLSNLSAVFQARDSEFKTFGRPIIVIPWTVIRELDYIKDDKLNTRPESLKVKARQAVRFLHNHFSKKHPRVLGQTPRDVADNREKFMVDCPDDEILQACLQIRDSNNSVVLLSYDKNLCNKAMIHDVATIGRHDPLEKIDYLNACEARDESFLARSLIENGGPNDSLISIYHKESVIAEKIYEEIKCILTELLTVIVVTEMKILYGDQWERFVIIRPPWSTISVLKCAIKHWIAAVSDSFIRQAQKIINDLHDMVTKVNSKRIKDVQHFTELVYDLTQSVQVQKYPNFIPKIFESVQLTRNKCFDVLREIGQESFKDEVGHEEDDMVAEQRAEKAFRHFEKVYEHARDICGLACEYIGMPCSIAYQKLEPLPSAEELKMRQPEIVGHIIQLLQYLGVALEDVNVLHPTHHSVKSLYNSLESFYTILFESSDDEISPLDVYCCLLKKDKSLRAGVKQLQELSIHFCRIASFRCK